MPRQLDLGVCLLHLILADSELELVPREIASHRVIRWNAHRRGRRPTEILLDSSVHYPAMRKLPDWTRRGRPDIVHFCLLLALDAPLNREGLLREYVHTRHDKLITLDPATRLPHTFNRFVGLMEHLFLTGAAPPDKPLLRLEDAPLADALARIKPTRTISFSHLGRRKRWKDIYRGISRDDDVCAIVGGFPHGSFISDVEELSDEIIGVDPEPLHAPTVVTRVIFAYEEALGIMEARQKR